jgi:hypothetical protein
MNKRILLLSTAMVSVALPAGAQLFGGGGSGAAAVPTAGVVTSTGAALSSVAFSAGCLQYTGGSLQFASCGGGSGVAAVTAADSSIIAAGTSSITLRVGTIALSSIPQSSATSGQALEWNGSAWAPANTVNTVAGRYGAVILSASDVSGLATVATTGSASSLTTGTLPAAQLPTIPLADIAPSGAATGQALEWNGSAWAPAGTINNFVAGSGLTGGTITNGGTVALSVPAAGYVYSTGTALTPGMIGANLTQSGGTLALSASLTGETLASTTLTGTTTNSGTLSGGTITGATVSGYVPTGNIPAGSAGQLVGATGTAGLASDVTVASPLVLSGGTIGLGTLPLADISSSGASSGQCITYSGGSIVWGSCGGGGSGTVTSVVAGTGLSGGTITSAGTISLGTVPLSSISTSGATASECIEYNGTLVAWASCGTGGGNWTATAVSALSSDLVVTSGTLGVVSTVPSAGVLVSNGTSVTPATLLGLGLSGTTLELLNASGSAGQVVTGASGGVMTFGTLSFSNLGGSATSSQLPSFGTSTAGIVPASGGGTANFLRADGTWQAPSGSGTVSSVVAGAGLTGGTITSAGTIALGTVPLGDIATTGASTGNCLTYNGSAVAWGSCTGTGSTGVALIQQGTNSVGANGTMVVGSGLTLNSTGTITDAGSGVTQIGTLTGTVALGSGLSQSGGSLANSGVLNLGGTTGAIALDSNHTISSGTLDLTSGAATNGYVLTANGSGGVSWAAQSGGGGGGASDTWKSGRWYSPVVNFNSASVSAGTIYCEQYWLPNQATIAALGVVAAASITTAGTITLALFSGYYGSSTAATAVTNGSVVLTPGTIAANAAITGTLSTPPVIGPGEYLACFLQNGGTMTLQTTYQEAQYGPNAYSTFGSSGGPIGSTGSGTGQSAILLAPAGGYYTSSTMPTTKLGSFSAPSAYTWPIVQMKVQ